MRRPLTAEQAAILRRDYQAKRVADARWTEAMALLGLDPADIVGGNLECAEPYLELVNAESRSAA